MAEQKAKPKQRVRKTETDYVNEPGFWEKVYIKYNTLKVNLHQGHSRRVENKTIFSAFIPDVMLEGKGLDYYFEIFKTKADEIVNRKKSNV